MSERGMIQAGWETFAKQHIPAGAPVGLIRSHRHTWFEGAQHLFVEMGRELRARPSESATILASIREEFERYTTEYLEERLRR